MARRIIGNVLVRASDMYAIADTIRTKLETNATYLPNEMATAIRAIARGDGSVFGSKNINENGVYSASSDSLDGYDSVKVAVGIDTTKIMNSLGSFFGDYGGTETESLEITLNGSIGQKALLIIMHCDTISVNNMTLVNSTKVEGEYDQWISIYEKILETSSETVLITQNSIAKICACTFFVRPGFKIYTPIQQSMDFTSETYRYEINRSDGPKLIVINNTWTEDSSTYTITGINEFLPSNLTTITGDVRLCAFIAPQAETNIVWTATTTINSDSLADNKVFIYDLTDNPIYDTKTITTNGTYQADTDWLEGYSSIIANVPNTYTTEDEGKVVSSGTLISQTSTTKITNGTYNTTANNKVTVALPLGSTTITENGIYHASGDSLEGYSTVTVAVPPGADHYNENNLKIAWGIMSGSIYDTLASGTISVINTNMRGYITGIEMKMIQQLGAGAFQSCPNITEASFPACTLVDSSAMRACTSLTKIYFPECSYIGYRAFSGCTNLSQAFFPRVEIIGDQAFGGCTKLSSPLSIPLCNQISAGAFSGCTSIPYVYAPNCSIIGDYAFYNCTSISQIRLGNVTQLYTYVFANCTKLQRFEADSIGALTSMTFANLASLTTVIIKSGIPAGIRNMFNGTPIANSALTGSFGSIYVASSLVDSFKTATNWSSYADRITAYIEE